MTSDGYCRGYVSFAHFLLYFPDEFTGLVVIKLSSFATQLSVFIMLINVRMPTICGILTFISRINDGFVF